MATRPPSKCSELRKALDDCRTLLEASQAEVTRLQAALKQHEYWRRNARDAAFNLNEWLAGPGA